MSEELIIAHCSPTMAGLKTASLFSCQAEPPKLLYHSLSRFNRKFVPKGVRMIPIATVKDRTLLYMYRPSMLEKDLSESLAQEILAQAGYPLGDVPRCIAKLRERLHMEANFPHEIGLFLGYPSEDVSGFMRLGAKHAKCVGAWRVYGDETAAKRKFALYEKCTRLYRASYHKHNSFDRLIVKR